MGVTVEKAVAMAGVIVARPTVLILVPAMVVARTPRLMPVAMIMAGMVVVVVVRGGVFITCHWWGEYKSSPVKAPKGRFAGRLQRAVAGGGPSFIARR